MKRMPVLVEFLLVAGLMCVHPLASAAPVPESSGTEEKAVIKPEAAGRIVVLEPSLGREVEAALNRGLDWLAANQNADGSWSDTNFPALTALPLWAFANSNHPDKQRVVDKAVKFLLGYVQANGGIYRDLPNRKGGGLSNYNTAICMSALHSTGKPELAPVVEKARKFIADGQYLGDDMYYGGFGYDRATDRAYTDLLNSTWVAEAMRYTQTPESKADLDWSALRTYIVKMQNTTNAGADQSGGFPYRPDESKAGTTTNQAGQVVLRSYGSMTYAGLLSMVFSNVERNDPRVKSAFDWAMKHWSLEENPGMGAEGLYFFYHVLTKSLAAYGQETLDVPGGKTVHWRSAVADKLVKLQKIDSKGLGYWVNNNNKFWEANPVLTTAYSILALELATGLK